MDTPLESILSDKIKNKIKSACLNYQKKAKEIAINKYGSKNVDNVVKKAMILQVDQSIAQVIEAYQEKKCIRLRDDEIKSISQALRDFVDREVINVNRTGSPGDRY